MGTNDLPDHLRFSSLNDSSKILRNRRCVTYARYDCNRTCQDHFIRRARCCLREACYCYTSLRSKGTCCCKGRATRSSWKRSNPGTSPGISCFLKRSSKRASTGNGSQVSPKKHRYFKSTCSIYKSNLLNPDSSRDGIWSSGYCGCAKSTFILPGQAAF
jgi:hypothetical protein